MLRNVCKVKSTKIYNSGNNNHPSQEDLTEIDNPFKKRKVKLISFSVILYLQQNKIILIALIITVSTALGFEPRSFDVGRLCGSVVRAVGRQSKDLGSNSSAFDQRTNANSRHTTLCAQPFSRTYCCWRCCVTFACQIWTHCTWGVYSEYENSWMNVKKSCNYSRIYTWVMDINMCVVFVLNSCCSIIRIWGLKTSLKIGILRCWFDGRFGFSDLKNIMYNFIELFSCFSNLARYVGSAILNFENLKAGLD